MAYDQPQHIDAATAFKNVNAIELSELLKIFRKYTYYIGRLIKLDADFTAAEQQNNEKVWSEILAEFEGERILYHYLVKKYPNLSPDIIKLSKASIGYPEAPGEKQVMGIIIPGSIIRMYGGNNYPFTPFTRADNITATMKVFGGQNDQETFRTSVRIAKDINVDQLIGTYEVGQVIKDCIGITLDFKNVDLPIFDPSVYFES